MRPRRERRRPAPTAGALALLGGLLLLGGILAGAGPRGAPAVGAEHANGEWPALVSRAGAAVRMAPTASPQAMADGEWDWQGYGLRALLGALLLPAAFWAARRSRTVNDINAPGFEVISPSEPRRYIPLEERFQALDFVSRIPTHGALRVSANLNKVTLSIRRYGYLMEDKNYRNALLVNRRRVRRTLLRDGDVLDLGDLTLLYRDNRAGKIVRQASITPPEGKAQIRFERTRGPVRKGTPLLVSEQTPNRTFYITKNKVYLGRSESNDLVIKARNVYYRHAKIERVGGRWKLQDLSVLGNTYVNGRRVEQRFLREGDEIGIESHRLRFELATRAVRDRPPRTTHPAGAEDGGDAAPQGLAAVPDGSEDNGEDTETLPAEDADESGA